MSAGWTCPGCGRGVAPDVKTCDHGGTVDLKGRDFVPLPYVPYPSAPPYYDTGRPVPGFYHHTVTD